MTCDFTIIDTHGWVKAYVEQQSGLGGPPSRLARYETSIGIALDRSTVHKFPKGFTVLKISFLGTLVLWTKEGN